jgi:hypothetical protein
MRGSTRQSASVANLTMMGLVLTSVLMAGCYHGYEKVTADYATLVKQSTIDFSAEFDLALSICQQQNRVYVFQKRLTAVPPSWGHDGFLADELIRLRAPDYVPAKEEQNCDGIVKVSTLHQTALRALAAYAHALQALADSDGIFGDSIKDTMTEAAKLATDFSGDTKTKAVSDFATALASPLNELAKLTAGAWATHELKEQIAEADGPVGKLVDALEQYVQITNLQVKYLESLQTGVLQTLEQQMADQIRQAGKTGAPIYGAVSVADLYALSIQWDRDLRSMRQAQTSYQVVLKKLRNAHSDLSKAEKLDIAAIKSLVVKVGNDLYVIYSESAKLRKALSAAGGAQ